jgi:hypothetical protein
LFHLNIIIRRQARNSGSVQILSLVKTVIFLKIACIHLSIIFPSRLLLVTPPSPSVLVLRVHHRSSAHKFPRDLREVTEKKEWRNRSSSKQFHPGNCLSRAGEGQLQIAFECLYIHKAGYRNTNNVPLSLFFADAVRASDTEPDN